MRIIYLCMGEILEAYYLVNCLLKEDQKVEKSGFYITHRRYFKKFKAKYPEFEGNYKYLSEWDITDRENSSFNMQKLENYQ